jgi:prepilin-type processing-associated H-X9-DG protein
LGKKPISPGRSEQINDPSGVYGCPAYNRVRGTYQYIFGAYAFNRGGVSGLAGKEHSPYGFAHPPRNGQLGLGGEVITRPVTNAECVRPIKDGEVLAPADMIALGDSLISALSHSVPGGGTKLEVVGMPDLSMGITSPSVVLETSLSPKATRNRHRAKWNIAFCDGHIETLKIKQLFAVRDDAVVSRWNKDNQPHPEYRPTDFALPNPYR